MGMLITRITLPKRWPRQALRFFLLPARSVRIRLQTLAFDLFHALTNALLDAFICRLIVHTTAQVIRQALHIGDFGFEVVGVLVALAVTQPFPQTRSEEHTSELQSPQ